MKINYWSDERIQKLIKKQESKSPNLKHLNTPTNNLHYFIGLLATDGNIRSKYYECRLMLSDTDTNLLEDIQRNFGGTLYKSKKYPRAELSIRYRPFITYLDSIGIKSKKTFNLDMTTYFNTLTEKEKWHFIRGCIDGDGSFSFFKTKAYYRGTFDLAGASKSFMEMIQDFLGEYTHIRKNKTCYMISINGRNIEKVLSKVYYLDNDSLYLKRKYEKYQTIVEYHSKTHYNPWNTVDSDLKDEILEYCKTHTISEAHNKYGFNCGVIREWCHNANIQWYKPPKREPYVPNRPREYTLKFKLKVLEYRKTHKNIECMKMFNIGKTTCNRWNQELNYK